MPTNSITQKDSRGKRNSFLEISDTEKQLWACIHSKGLLDIEVKDLYHEACCIYESLFLSDNELPDIQHMEYLLWRLHYKHIDEFRKRISQNSAKEEDKQSTFSKLNTVDEHMEGFKLFLSKATKFYQELIRKIKRYYGLLQEPWFYKSDGVSGRIEQTKLHKCQFLCHRLCICLGDLARYLELHGKPDNEERNWSIAASYYLEAAKIYPDSGNPHNQLAVLATYIGDDFLALYHCIRSLAVREPFPDALQNLMLLFERNRSSNISSLSNDVCDFCNPSEWISSQSKVLANGNCSDNTTSKAAEGGHSTATDLWSLIIRTTSFFFLESSLDSFPCTFTSTVRELEISLALDVAKLSSVLESYKNLKLSKAGPYRALHVISVLLFIIHILTEKPEHMILKPVNEAQQSVLVKLALTTTFMFMGRLVDRCLKGSPVIYFPLLPALLVFVEWLVGSIDKVYIDDGKCENAMCYFFTCFVELLNHLQEAPRDQVKFPDQIALWEDYELRGFIPLSHTHLSLDFSSHWEEEINYKMKNDYRAYRIVQAAMKIAKKSSDSNARKWIFYAREERKFRTQGRKDSEKEAKETRRKDTEKTSLVEEEEDIVFKPITRHNSEPIPVKFPAIVASSSSSSDECLRRASSVLVAQNRALINSLTSHSPRNNPLVNPNKQPGTFPEGPIAAGPPSLSSWVLNKDGFSSEGDRRMLKPIDEMVSSDFGSLSLSKDETSGIPSPCYSPPVPSASMLPENSFWFTHNSTGFSPPNTATHHQPPSFVPTFFPPNHSGIFQPGPPTPNLIDYSPLFPILGTHNLDRVHNGALGSEGSRFDLSDGWRYNNPPMFPIPNVGPPLLHPSSPLLRGLYDQRTDMLFQGFQRPSPFVSQSQGMTAISAEPHSHPHVQFLKQREWQQLPRGTQFTGFPYMQN